VGTAFGCYVNLIHQLQRHSNYDIPAGYQYQCETWMSVDVINEVAELTREDYLVATEVQGPTQTRSLLHRTLSQGQASRLVLEG
jgi:hypothetical protein